MVCSLFYPHLPNSPIPVDPTEACGLWQVICIQQPDTFFNQGLPHRISRAYWVGRGIPVPADDAFRGSKSKVRAQGGKLGVVEFSTLDLPNIAAELS